MKGLKSLAIGASVTIFNIGTVITQVFRAERCTGSCGSCGFSCVNPVVGLAGIGILVIIFRKLKGKTNSIKILLKKYINMLLTLN